MTEGLIGRAPNHPTVKVKQGDFIEHWVYKDDGKEAVISKVRRNEDGVATGIRTMDWLLVPLSRITGAWPKSSTCKQEHKRKFTGAV